MKQNGKTESVKANLDFVLALSCLFFIFPTFDHFMSVSHFVILAIFQTFSSLHLL